MHVGDKVQLVPFTRDILEGGSGPIRIESKSEFAIGG